MMKPHPSIFVAALQLAGVDPRDAVMVGDSVRQDIEGARRIGMKAVLLHRSHNPHPREHELKSQGIPVIQSLRQLPDIL